MVTASSSSARPTGVSRLRAARNTRSRASAISSCEVRSSMVSKCGATPASSGNRRRRAPHRAWIVMIASPRGSSSTRANRRRARSICWPSGGLPVSASSSATSAGSSRAVAQAASRSSIRTVISAAAALVKVMHRMPSGSLPSSNRRSTRSASTLVLPVPAFAVTQTEWAGSAERRCAGVGARWPVTAPPPSRAIPRRGPGARSRCSWVRCPAAGSADRGWRDRRNERSAAPPRLRPHPGFGADGAWPRVGPAPRRQGARCPSAA